LRAKIDGLDVAIFNAQAKAWRKPNMFSYGRITINNISDIDLASLQQ